MKTQSVVNTRLIENKERLLLNFVFSLWFEKALEDVNNGKDEKKKKRYAQLDPFKMVAEPPVVFKEDYFYMCAADRPGGTLLVDKKVPYLTLDTFLEKAKASDKITSHGRYNEKLDSAVKNKTLTFSLISDLLDSQDERSYDPVYYLTQINDDNGVINDGEYFIIYDCKTINLDFDSLVSWIFRDYTFEEISFERPEKGDSDYPSKEPIGTEPASFYTGTVTLKDSVFKEKTLTFHLVDMKLLGEIVIGIVPKILTITPPANPEPILPTDTTAVIGEGTVLSLNAKASRVKSISGAIRADDNFDVSGIFSIIDKKDRDLIVEFQPKDFKYEYTFPYSTGERRRLKASISIDSNGDSHVATIPVKYELEENSITPVIKKVSFLDVAKNHAAVVVCFLDKENKLIEKAATQYLGSGYKMFENDPEKLSFIGPETRWISSGPAGWVYNTLVLDVTLTQYGEVNFKFADPALKDVSFDVPDPKVPAIVDVTPTAPEPISPSAEEQVIGKGTVITTSTKVASGDVLLNEVKDDLGNDLTTNSELVATSNGDKSITASIKVKDLDYAYSFNYPTGERRRVAAAFNIKGQVGADSKATIPVSYDLENASITPVIESMDFTNGLSNAEIQLSFLDKDNNPISKVVPQTLGEGYKMFDTDNDVLTFLGEATQFGESNEETAKNILKFNIALKNYGSVDFKFTDPALKEITYDVVDPDAKLTVDLVKIDYTDDTLTLTYNVLQNGTIYETDEKQYTNIGLPKITLNDTVYKPQTTWTKAGLINTYVIGKGVNATNVMVRGQIMIGANSVIAGFMDNITITAPEDIPETTATISTIALNGGYVTPSAEKTTTEVGSGSVIIISDANQVKANGIKLTRFTDALGVDITDKVSTVFTQLDDDATQFGINMTITNYQWPMSFDNQGSNGEFECEFKLLGNPDSAVSAKTSYKLSYGYEGITPRPLNAQLSNNSLNKAVIFIAFYDKYYQVFETGLEQNISINPPLFGNSDITYIGDKITYGMYGEHNYGAYIPVNFRQFGDLSLSFADTTFKTVTTSVADPNGKYTLEAFDEKFADSGDYMVRFRLNKDGKPYSLNDGTIIENSLKALIDDKDATITAGWSPNPDTGAVLNLYITLPEGTDKATFTAKISGQFNVGINKVPLDVAYETEHAPV